MKNKTSLFLFLYCFFFSAFVFSENIDVTDSRQILEDLGLPTVPRINILLVKADEAYKAADWTTAIILYDRVAQETNWMANVITAAAAPYYSASVEELRDFSPATGLELVPCENAANEYKQQRNIAIARIGFCYEKLGNPKDAIPYLLKALELLSVSEDAIWRETRESLYRLINFEPQ